MDEEYIFVNSFVNIILLQFIILLLVIIYNLYNRLKLNKGFKKYENISNNLKIKYYNDIENQYNKMN
jgi:uncharacterized membrane protein YdbT with pleckstrin-like domain